MERNGYTIKRGFIRDWDKTFAHPTQPWTLEKSETDEFLQHEEWTTLETIIEKVLFETEQPIFLKYLIGYMIGLPWKYVILNTRETIQNYFKRNNITGTAKTAWWLRLQARGLEVVVDPTSGIDVHTVIPPENPLGGIISD